MHEGGPSKKQGAGEITTLEQKIRILKKMGIRQIYAPDFSDFRNLSGEAFVRQILKEKMNAAAVCCGQDFRFGKGASCDAESLSRFCKTFGLSCTVLEEVMDGGEAVSSTGCVRQLPPENGKGPATAGSAVLFGFSRGAWQGTGPQIAVSDY